MGQELQGRARRRRRIRKKILGNEARPRMTVFRSARHIYVQVVDDRAGNTLAATSTRHKEFSATGVKTEHAKSVGALIAKQCLSKGISKVVFDRNGYMYHGRVKALADAAREAGLEF